MPVRSWEVAGATCAVAGGTQRVPRLAAVISERSKPKSLELQDLLGDGRQCALCAPGSGVGGLGAGCACRLAQRQRSRLRRALGVRLSKIRGGRLLTGVGGDGYRRRGGKDLVDPLLVVGTLSSKISKIMPPSSSSVRRGSRDLPVVTEERTGPFDDRSREVPARRLAA